MAASSSHSSCKNEYMKGVPRVAPFVLYDIAFINVVAFLNVMELDAPGIWCGVAENGRMVNAQR